MTAIPSTQENIDASLAYLEAAMSQDSALNDKAFLMVLSRLQGTTKSELYQYAIERSTQVLVSEATGEDLTDLANDYQLERKAAVATSLTVRVPGVDGTVVPVTSTWIGRVNNIRYFQNVASTVSGGYADVVINADTTGTVGNLEIGSVVEFGGDTVDGINPESIVTGTVIEGADPETEEELRLRLFDAIRYETGGSNQADVRIWGQEAPNVKRVDPYTGNYLDWSASEPGERTVFVEATEAFSPDGIPTQTVLDAVRAKITYDEDGKTRQCLGSVDSLLYVVAITRKQFIFTVRQLTIPDGKLEVARTDIRTALAEYTKAVLPYISGLDAPSLKNNVITSVAASEVVQDVVKSYGGYAATCSFGITSGTYLDSYEMNPGERADSTVEFLDAV